MSTSIDLSAPPALTPLSWLIGSWAGAGVMVHPDEGEVNFGQEATFTHDGRDFLRYNSQTWLLDKDGNKTEPGPCETGYWRSVMPDDLEKAKAGEGVDIEVVLAQPAGLVEVYVGTSNGGRMDLATDVVARTASAEGHAAAKRLYGLVEGDLMWVLEHSHSGKGLSPVMSARLKKVS